ncbi:uncharacterized protein TM35_000431470 [Trypanosoma theileri]|uniref:DUF3456 domain-containing protein n=1 Tax=Trypanosoma theileri TaxID=67003 RepID=A0A1X0NK90_9TRYP|nr:uncharacterized protein TM35_000431470 [Trypanosoma theileri]ORC84579.1 hypothetical protein TM35_000431470 [Trypanosoma theileri]
MRLVPLLLSLLLILSVTTLYTISAARLSIDDMEEGGNIDDQYVDRVEDNHPVHKLLPDPQDPEMLPSLKCSACGAVIEEAIHLMRPAIVRYLERRRRDAQKGKDTQNDKGPSEYETVDAFEKLCRRVSMDYALEMKSEKVPSLFFTKSKASQRVHGGWMPFFLSSTCEELVEDEEDRLRTEIFAAAVAEEKEISVAHMDFLTRIALRVRQSICPQWSRSAKGCDPRGFPIDPRKQPLDDL